MHAFLIVGDAGSFLKDHSGRKIEFPFAKIADVRELNNFLRLTLTEKTVVVLHAFDKATEEAQNAFLKSLEEPQSNLTFVLEATNIEGVLSTIVSRCEVKEVASSKQIVDREDKEKILNFIDAEVGEKLKYISAITKREEAIEFANNLTLMIHEQLPKNWKVAAEALILKKNLEANGNVGLQLTNFVVSIS